MMIIRIIKPLQSIGYDIDCNIYKKFIEDRYSNYTVIISNSSIKLDKKDDIHIYISNTQYRLTKMARVRIFMINHELFLHSESELAVIKNVDYILCRTKIGYELASQIKQKHNLNYEIIYTRFTSLFPTIDIPKIHNLILHSAGEHYWKQTDAIIKTWIKNPDLPLIVITCSGQCYDNIKEILKNGTPKNMTLYRELLDKEKFVELKNKCGIHLCPSIVEGYGHYINEARKVKSLIITSNHPPMNELVNKFSGILIDCSSYGKKRNGATLCFIDDDDIKNAVIGAINMKLDEKKEMITKSYNQYNEETDFFNNSMEKLFNKIVR